MKIPSSNLGRTCCVQKLFLTFRTIFIHNKFSPYSAKKRASEKDLPEKAALPILSYVVRKVAWIFVKCSVRLFRLVLSYFVVFEKECEFGFKTVLFQESRCKSTKKTRLSVSCSTINFMASRISKSKNSTIKWLLMWNGFTPTGTYYWNLGSIQNTFKIHL